MFDPKEYKKIMKLKNEEFIKELDLKNSLYVPTEKELHSMYENLLLVKINKNKII